MNVEALPLLIFDGDCGFCTSSAKWVAPEHSAAWQRLGPDRLAGLGLAAADVRDAAWWIDESGRKHRGHLAIARSLAAAGGGKAVLGRILLVPPFRWLAAAAYPLVARWRHRLPGGTPACRI